MIQKLAVVLLMVAAPTAFAKQTLQAAMAQSPTLTALVGAVKASAGVDCLTVDSAMSVNVRGPQGLKAVTQQVACFDPEAFNPNQLGQLVVTYYGDGSTNDSAVGAVIEVQFEVFK
ncbi:MAG: hypothetical protein KF799_11190 [Bdellovibrionales bacterium]|nr:hypothetical protein [Bdellovibrionales bacterium]